MGALFRKGGSGELLRDGGDKGELVGIVLSSKF